MGGHTVPWLIGPGCKILTRWTLPRVIETTRPLPFPHLYHVLLLKILVADLCGRQLRGLSAAGGVGRELGRHGAGHLVMLLHLHHTGGGAEWAWV